MSVADNLAKAVQWLESMAMDEETKWAQERARVLLADRKRMAAGLAETEQVFRDLRAANASLADGVKRERDIAAKAEAEIAQTKSALAYLVAWTRHGEGDEATAAELADAALARLSGVGGEPA